VNQNDEVQGSVPNFRTWQIGPVPNTWISRMALKHFGFLGLSPWEKCFSNSPRSENRQQRQIVHRALHYSSLWMTSGWQRSFATDSLQGFEERVSPLPSCRSIRRAARFQSPLPATMTWRARIKGRIQGRKPQFPQAWIGPSRQEDANSARQTLCAAPAETNWERVK
jgi:hypothetical protein